jgi:hypothetical protein
MEAVHRCSGARFELFTTSPRWFYDESVEGLYRYHRVVTDVGFRQRSALEYDLDATAAALAHMIPFDEELVERLARQVHDSGCRAVLCDISPLGIAVAERAGLPSILVESFTWPWLYEPLLAGAPGLVRPSEEMARWFGRATVHIQTEPPCAVDERAEMIVPPIARPVKHTRRDVRRMLGLSLDVPVVVITMGGVREDLPFLSRLRHLPDIQFVVTGAPATGVHDNVHAFDSRARIYMPDLVHAADGVVAKLGYSTVAEVWMGMRPLAYVTRADFRETAPLREWVQSRLDGFEIPGAEFAKAEWLNRVPALLEELSPRALPQEKDSGAARVAHRIVELVDARA